MTKPCHLTRARHLWLQHPCTRNGKMPCRHVGTSSSQHQQPVSILFPCTPLRGLGHRAAPQGQARSPPGFSYKAAWHPTCSNSSRRCSTARPLQSHYFPAPQQAGQDSHKLSHARGTTTPLLSTWRREEGGESIQSHFPTSLNKLMQKSSQRVWL